MAFTARDIGAMSLWEFEAQVAGYIKANNPDSDKGLSSEEIKELSDMLDRFEGFK